MELREVIEELEAMRDTISGARTALRREQKLYALRFAIEVLNDMFDAEHEASQNYFDCHIAGDRR